MSQCAYRLGMAFGAEAERAAELDKTLEYFQLFDRCFFAVRVATALELRLARTPAAWPREPASDREDLRDRADPSDGPDTSDGDEPGCERPERADAERDRERETEAASLPLLLHTLHGVAADAARLPGPEPAALPTLRELLAHAATDPRAPATPPAAAFSLRARLTGSGAGRALTLAPSALAPSRSAGALAVRRATGPPRR
jgi:hypothetical protein